MAPAAMVLAPGSRGRRFGARLSAALDSRGGKAIASAVLRAKPAMGRFDGAAIGAGCGGGCRVAAAETSEGAGDSGGFG